jgi:hypothetical protein
MMPRTLKISVQRANAKQALASLRVSPKGDLEPLQSETARAELLQRIEKIQVRGAELSNSYRGAGGHSGSKRQLGGRTPEISAPDAGLATMLERCSQAASAFPKMDSCTAA